jgi:hypothetical protein
MDRIEWRWEDGWVLASIVCASRGQHRGLAELIHAADYINRLIPDREEIERATNRLRAAGLVADADSFVPLDEALALWDRTAASDGVLARTELLVVLLNEEVPVAEPTSPHWSLREEQYRRAVELNSARFEQRRRAQPPDGAGEPSK